MASGSRRRRCRSGERVPASGIDTASWCRRWGFSALRGVFGLVAVAGGEFVEEEAGALGDVFGVAGGVGAAGVLEAGGVFDGEAVGVEGVGGDGFFVGETEAVGPGGPVVGIGDGAAEEFSGASKGGKWEVEFATGPHDVFFAFYQNQQV